jgi:hypothetical protein
MPVIAVQIAAAEPPGVEQVEVAPDAAIQGAIAAYAEATSEADRRAALERIAALDDATHERLVRQVMHFSSHANDTRRAMAAGVIVRRLGISDDAIVRALAPLLNTTDRELGKSIRSVLGGIEGRSAGRRPDFSCYRELIAEPLRRGAAPPTGLVRYMYDADAGEALLLLMRAHELRRPEEIKPILWAEHVVADVLWKQRYGFLAPDAIEPAAAEELAGLACHGEWWARLYAAEIMRQYPAFRQTEVIGGLRSDAHPLVRQAAAGL